MKQIVEALILQAVSNLQALNLLAADMVPTFKVEKPKDPLHGNFSSNVALVLSKMMRQAPLKVAEQLLAHFPQHPALRQIEIAGPGFLNFFVDETAQTSVISSILEAGTGFGQNKSGQGQRILLEYVSANPTGPLHVGHGRSAAFGASLANILKANGFELSQEYYVNDAGRQMNILALSVWLRYLECCGEIFSFPANAYRGEYVKAIAKPIFDREPKTYIHPWSLISEDLPLDEPEGGDKEKYIDALIIKAKTLLTEEGFSLFFNAALEAVLSDIKADLAEFGVHYDLWFSERSLFLENAIERGIADLKKADYTYMKEGALWFRATDFGDEKDRVLVRANGQPTYFASDVAYHWHKYKRGFSKVIDIFGADHHGYVGRIKAGVHALGHDDSALHFILVQFAILYRGQERVQMSTRSGSFVTLRALREEVGNDAARFFYVMRKPEQHMDFDLELAKSESKDNPVYYIQYAHARIASVFRQLQERGLSFDEKLGLAHLDLLQESQELTLIECLNRYAETVLAAAKAYAPHLIAYYLRELATGLHSYYNAVPLLAESAPLRNARLALVKSVKQVLSNGLALLGVHAPESM